MLFRWNKALWALQANGVDAAGRPLPAPRVGNGTGSGNDGDTLRMGDDQLLRLPGTSSLTSLVPDIKYDDALNVLAAQLQELERDLPELAYYRLRDLGDLSGRAVRLLLSDAIDKLLEVRGNAEAALIQADQMALTVGQQANLPGFQNLAGDFASGALDHRFADRPVIPTDEYEDAQTAQLIGDASVKKLAAGWSQTAVYRDAGMTETEIEQVLAEKAQEEAAAPEPEPQSFGAEQ